ncbi:hypothetical protein [uncultured Roseovarius sp.]|uniref:hypothetical protein n=1 Tax=uncultured Roseovarius sp. TaxID=293344 RepID=UPI00260AAE55|nr:hypothetical protein [uncultured Roseovarius sp.]
MMGRLDWLGLAVIAGWAGFAMAGLVVEPGTALATGGVLAVFTLVFCRSRFVRGAMALLSPVGLGLPALALRDVAGDLGLPIRAFHMMELVVFLVAYLAFLASAAGVLRIDLYRLGYAPVPVGGMVLAVCAYGILSGGLFLPVLAVLAQATWLAGWGSSNWFDHLLHAMLVPVLLVTVLVGLL